MSRTGSAHGFARSDAMFEHLRVIASFVANRISFAHAEERRSKMRFERAASCPKRQLADLDKSL
jgi:hypothetical protein